MYKKYDYLIVGSGLLGLIYSKNNDNSIYYNNTLSCKVHVLSNFSKSVSRNLITHFYIN